MKTPDPTRCPWCLSSEKMIKYHDKEWGVPLHEDQVLFEYIVLDAFQAGLSWSTVINKRENFRKAFKNFEPEKVARFGTKTVEKLILDKGIIRNRLKINSAITNARAFLSIQSSYGSFDKYIWQFSEGKTIHNKWKSINELPPKTTVSDKMSKDLIQKGFKFVGSTICYAFMQAAGMVNDHLTNCYRHKELIGLKMKKIT